MLSEKDLVRLARAGDQSAFEALVTAYEKKIYNLSLRYLGNREDAMDASQEVFLRVYRFLNGFQEESSFSTWIYRIGVNVCKDILTQKKRRAEQSLEMQDEDDESRTVEIADERYDPEILYSGRELQDALCTAITELPPKLREILLLRDVHGLSYEEIGEALSLESGTVKSRLARARENLRKKLLQNGNISGNAPSNLTKGGESNADM